MNPKIEKLQKEFDAAKAEIETLRTRSAEDITDADAHNKEYETVLSRAESIKASLEKELAAAKTLDSTASLFAELNGLSKVEEAVKVRGAAKDSGEWFFHYCKGEQGKNAESLDVLSRSATLVTSSTSSGLVPYTIVGDVTRYVDDSRYLINAFGVSPVPNGTGWKVRVESGSVVTAVQANEGDDVGGSNTIAVTYVDVTPATYAGSILLSLQAMTDTDPSAADLNMKALVRSYAISTETAVAAAFRTAVTTNVGLANSGATLATILEAIYYASDTVYTNSGEHADTIFVSPDVRRWLATRVGSDGHALFPTINPSNRMGFGGGANWNDGLSIGGLSVVVVPRFASSTFIVGNRSYGKVWESMYPMLEAYNVAKLQKEIAYAGELGYRFDAKGFVKIYDTDGNSAATPNFG